MPKTKKPSPKPSRKGSAFWFSMLIFASVWMFVLGVLVGRGTAPVHFDIEKFQKELAALKKAAIKKEENRYKISSDATSDAKTFGFYETLKEKKSDSNLYPANSKQKRKTSSKKKFTETKKKRIPDKVKATKSATESKTGSSINKTKKGKFLTIQVASLKDPKAADEMVAKLKKKGYAAYRTTAYISGKGIWFRVRIGNFKNRDEAKNILNRLKKANQKGVLMVR